MKRILSLLIFTAILSLLVGCTEQAIDEKEKAPKVSLEEIATQIKEQIAEDMKAKGAGEDVLVDGNLQSFIETDLKESEEDDPAVAILLEKMQLNKEEFNSGIVIAAMMNVNSDEIILLEASDEAHVDKLKESLERELEAQIHTWEQYLPDQYEKVKKNIITTKGNYLLYVTYEHPEKIKEVFDQNFE